MGEKGSGYRNVVSMGLVSLFTDISSEMVFGLIPLFITGQLGYSRFFVGVIEGAGELFGHTLRMASGTASDRIGKRKPLIIAGYSLSAVTKPFFAVAASWTDVFAVRSIERAGKGIRTAPRDALISESVNENRVGRAFGIHRSLDQVGAIIGPVIAFLLFPFVGFAGIFILSLVPGGIALLILILFVKETRTFASMPEKKSVKENMRIVLGEKKFVAIVAIMGLFSLGAFNFAFVLVRASDLGVSDNMVIALYAIINVAHTLVGLPAGILADRIGKENVLAIGYGIFLASTILMLTSTSSIHTYFIAIIFGIYIGVSETVQRATISRYASPSLRGTAYGIYNLVIGVSFLAANVTFGFLLDTVGITTAAAYSMATSIIAIIAIIAFQIKTRPLVATK